MIYAAFTVWLIVAVFAAAGVHAVLSRMVQPRIINGLLLPGTLVAQLGHVLGLLITGNQVTNTALMRDDQGTPAADVPKTQKVPLLGGVLVGVLPLVASGAALSLAVKLWGARAAPGLPDSAAALPRRLPMNIAEVWEALRAMLTLGELTLAAFLRCNLTDWSTALFIYVVICLTVRMAPLPGNHRGVLLGMLVGGLLLGLVGSAAPAVSSAIETLWPVLSLAVGALVALLLLSLVISALVALGKLLVRNS